MNYKCNFLFLNFYWSKSGLPFCVSFRCTAKQISYTYTCTSSFFLNSFPYRSLQSIEQSSLYYTPGFSQLSILYIAVCMSSPISQCIPPLLTSGNHKFVFYIHDSKESISLYLFFFGSTTQHARSQFSHQGLNLYPLG